MRHCKTFADSTDMLHGQIIIGPTGKEHLNSLHLSCSDLQLIMLAFLLPRIDYRYLKCLYYSERPSRARVSAWGTPLTSHPRNL